MTRRDEISDSLNGLKTSMNGIFDFYHVDLDMLQAEDRIKGMESMQQTLLCIARDATQLALELFGKLDLEKARANLDQGE